MNHWNVSVGKIWQTSPLLLRMIAREIKNSSWDEEDGTREVALKALAPAPGATLLGAWLNVSDELVGVATYRLIDGLGIKRICTATKYHRFGIASAIIRWQIAAHPGLPMWAKSMPSAQPFCRRIGMTDCGPPDDGPEGSRVMRWTAEEAAAFLAKGAPPK